ncbi:hypothetical protein P154DRAFT_274829 [Amniculicola lignicola CBS 123094]|uniref:Uncharacterized protein n=1 Tax=Amniculicola lignicola CBS 123094 TaxID=1392246 RepID=A0A6A5WIT0_9PLEO|nr:hypothetical protein P154DRAFT_274829 [Amniculicola lignicola CBS 123094]
MASDAAYRGMRAEIPEIKQLFQTRHYIQCASLCGRLLTNSNEIDPVHQAYLHFFLALSHDAIAREASIRNRRGELDVAEKHFLAAIAALSRSSSPKQEEAVQSHSPTSSHSSQDFSPRGASDANSMHSDHSASTNATSFAGDDDEEEPFEYDSEAGEFNYSSRFRTILDDFPKVPKSVKRRPSPIITCRPSRTPSIHEVKFSADMYAFQRMVETHLAAVRELKDACPAPSVRFAALPNSRPASFSMKSNRASVHDEAEKEIIRAQRRSMVFRPRFDPTSVQKLCEEVLSEL